MSNIYMTKDKLIEKKHYNWNGGTMYYMFSRVEDDGDVHFFCEITPITGKKDYTNAWHAFSNECLAAVEEI